MSSEAHWQPLLEGAAADETWAKIREIAEALRDPDRLPGKYRGGAGLAGGSSGIALFYAYLERADAGAVPGLEDLIATYVDRSIEALGSQPMSPPLYAGFTGIAWMVDHLEGLFPEDEDGDEDGDETEIDQGVRLYLERQPWHDHYDLIGGLAGYAVYALEGLPRPGARRCLELVVDHFEKLAVDAEPARTWFTGPELLPPHQRETCPDGYYNLGVAHGMPAVLAVLAYAAAAGVKTETARALVEDGVTWLLAQELEPGRGGCFASWMAPGLEPNASRLAWCYGDLGLATTLLAVARSMGRDDWAAEARRIAHVAAERPEAQSGVRDAGLCHGAAGLAHLFHRLFRATGDAKLEQAARFWFAKTLAMAEHKTGIAGYLAELPTGDLKGTSPQPDPGFLTGAAGIALALLGAVSDVEPGWDRILLADPHPLGPGETAAHADG